MVSQSSSDHSDHKPHLVWSLTFGKTSITSTGEWNNHYHLAERGTLQSGPSINHLPCSNKQWPCHNTNICFNDQETVSIEQLRPVTNKTSLWESVMVEQPINHAAIFAMETFDGTKGKFESWIVFVENAALISGQNILCIAFSKMVGSPLTQACWLRDHLPHLTWNNLKMSYQGNIPLYPLTVMPDKLFPIFNKVLMSYLKCTSC